MGTLPIPEFKVILCGEYGVGKTSLFRRFLNDSFVDTSKMSQTQTRQSTLGSVDKVYIINFWSMNLT